MVEIVCEDTVIPMGGFYGGNEASHDRLGADVRPSARGRVRRWVHLSSSFATSPLVHHRHPLSRVGIDSLFTRLPTLRHSFR
jgi:hypothetical protein